MCKQLLLFAQTTCSFWTQTTLWRTMWFTSAGVHRGRRAHEGSLSTWCRLHQMVWPCKDGSQLRQNSAHWLVFAVWGTTSNKKMAGKASAKTFGRCTHHWDYVALPERIGSPLCSVAAKKKKKCLVCFSKAEALGGMITKVIKRVIAKSQQESGNATYSISLSYGIYRKNTDKQRA